MKYYILGKNVYWKDPVRVLFKCDVESETGRIVTDLHSGYCGGNYAWKTTAHKILKSRFYRPSFFLM